MLEALLQGSVSSSTNRSLCFDGLILLVGAETSESRIPVPTHIQSFPQSMFLRCSLVFDLLNCPVLWSYFQGVLTKSMSPIYSATLDAYISLEIQDSSVPGV